MTGSPCSRCSSTAGRWARLGRVNTGLRWAEHARPLVADHYAFADAPRALVALGRSEHPGKIVVGV